MIYGIHSNHTYYLLFPSPCPSPSPLNYTILLSSQISLRTSKSLNTIYFDEDDLISVKRKVDTNKGQGHDQISIGILQICGKAICKPSYLIIFSCIESGIFPTVWKMANVASSHNWDDNTMSKVIDLLHFSQYWENIWKPYIPWHVLILYREQFNISKSIRF